MASVTPRRNRDGSVSWRVQARHEGTIRQRTFIDRESADKFGLLVDRIGFAEADDILSRESRTEYTLTAWTEHYLDQSSGLLTGVEPSTRQGYQVIARKSFLKFMGDYPLDTIKKQDIGKWVAWQERQATGRGKSVQPISAKTMRNYHALLSKVLGAAKEAGITKDNPAFRTRLSRGMAREAVFLSRDDFERLYNAFPDYYKPLVAFLVGSQCRWSEATALQWKHINTDTTPPTIRVAQAWKKATKTEPARIDVPKTKRGRRTISVWPELIAALGEPGAPDDFVFTGRYKGNRLFYSPFRKVWDIAIERSGLDPRPTVHDLRHTGASWLIADGKSLAFIQARLGHESITTTVNTYGHLLPDAHTQMAASLQGIMSNVLPTRALEA